jgi:hypothetical protein
MSTVGVRNDEGFAEIFVNGVKLHISFTPETTDLEVSRFVALCEKIEYQLVDIHYRYKVALNDNYKRSENGGKGINHPVFNEWERLCNKLCKQAGIVDT